MDNSRSPLALTGLALIALVAAAVVICSLLVFEGLSAIATVGIALVALLVGGGALGALVTSLRIQSPR